MHGGDIITNDGSDINWVINLRLTVADGDDLASCS